jgi:hypothetical protein
VTRKLSVMFVRFRAPLHTARFCKSNTIDISDIDSLTKTTVLQLNTTAYQDHLNQLHYSKRIYV